MEERSQPVHKGLQKILLADDDPDDRDLFEEAASSVAPDIKITVAQDGVELMDYLRNQKYRPDLIFLDLNMPRKNGKECLIEISNDKDLKSIPVIIFSTSLNPLDIDDTFNQGAFHFFRKPNSFEELKNILHNALHASIENATSRMKEKFVLNSNYKMDSKWTGKSDTIIDL